MRALTVGTRKRKRAIEQSDERKRDEAELKRLRKDHPHTKSVRIETIFHAARRITWEGVFRVATSNLSAFHFKRALSVRGIFDVRQEKNSESKAVTVLRKRNQNTEEANREEESRRKAECKEKGKRLL